jgi:sugar phosphate isomerase/epimerase
LHDQQLLLALRHYPVWLPPSIEDTFAAIREEAEIGFRYIELEGVEAENLRAILNRRREIKKLCDDLGVQVVNFTPVLHDLVSQDLDRRRTALDLFREALDAAVEFGCRTVQVDSYLPPLQFLGEVPYQGTVRYDVQYRVAVDPAFDWNRFWAGLVESFTQCTRLARDAGLRFCLEPRVGETVCTTDGMLRLLDAVGDDHFGVVLDTAHLHAQKEILPLSVEKLGRRIFMVHAADNDGRTPEHNVPGRGTIDWDGVWAALRKHGFAGCVSVDVAATGDLQPEYREALRFLEQLNRRTGPPARR